MFETTHHTTHGEAHSAGATIDCIPSADLIDEAVRRLGSPDEVARRGGVRLDAFEAFMEAAKTADAT
jgi:hypothetical protein